MFNLVKSIASDFPLGITHHHLFRDIISAGVSYCKEIYQDGDNLIIAFSSDYTGDLSIINTVISDYRPVPAYFDDLKFVTLTTSDSPYQIITKSVKCNTTGGNITVQLPKSQRAKKGTPFAIHKIAAAGIVTIVPNGVETINGQSSLQLTSLGSYFVLTNDGTNWSNVVGRINTTASPVETSAIGDILVDNGSGLEPLHVGSDGQVLVSDSAQPLKVRWGAVAGGAFPSCTQINNSIITTTTSASYVLISGMTTTPAAGSYLVLFSATGSTSASSIVGNYGIYVGGSLVASSEQPCKWSNATTNIMHTVAKITVNGSQTVEIRYKTSAGTFTVNSRNLILVSVA